MIYCPDPHCKIWRQHTHMGCAFANNCKPCQFVHIGPVLKPPCHDACEMKGQRHLHCDSCTVPIHDDPPVYGERCGVPHCNNPGCSRYEHYQEWCKTFRKAEAECTARFRELQRNPPPPPPKPTRGWWEGPDHWEWIGKPPCSADCVDLLGYWCGGCEEPERWLEKKPDPAGPSWGDFSARR